jgi:SUA5 domain.
VTVFDGDRAAVRNRIARETFSLKEGKCGVLTTDGGESFYKENAREGTVVLSLGNRDDMLSLTHNLFSRLREFDALGVTAVFAEAVPATGIGNAVMNRLYRAAGGKVINC